MNGRLFRSESPSFPIVHPRLFHRQRLPLGCNSLCYGSCLLHGVISGPDRFGMVKDILHILFDDNPRNAGFFRRLKTGKQIYYPRAGGAVPGIRDLYSKLSPGI
jgi:hypothetical protein